jgi:hypothetical protein
MKSRKAFRAEASAKAVKASKRTRTAPERYASLQFDRQGSIIPRASYTLDDDDRQSGSEHANAQEEEPDDVDSEDGGVEKDYDDIDLPAEDIDTVEEFVSEKQPDDKTRHQLALLQLPPNKKWSEKDLEKEIYLRVGLHLLYNKIHGGSWLHLGRSIHISYLHFSQKVINTMQASVAISKERKEAVKSI